MGVLNLSSLPASVGSKGDGASVVSPLLQMLLKNASERSGQTREYSHLEQAALDAEQSLPQNKGKNPLLTMLKPEGYEDIPETIRRPEEQLTPYTKNNPEYMRIPRTKDAIEKASELTLKSQFGTEKPKNVSIPDDMRKYLVSTQNIHKNDMTTPEGEAGGLRYIGTPEGSKGYEEWNKKTRAELYPKFNFVWTPNGLVAFDQRNPQAPGVDLKTQKPATPEQQEKLALLTELRNKALTLKQQVRPEYVGMVDKPLGSVTRLLGLNNPEQDEFLSNANDLKEYLFSQGGKALTATELAQISPSIPNPLRQSYSTDLDTFIKKLDNRISAINQVAGSMGTATYNQTGGNSTEPDFIFSGGKYIPNPKKRK